MIHFSTSRIDDFLLNADRARQILRYFALLSAIAISFLAAPALSMTQAEDAVRKQQEALVWTTEYEGLMDGHVGPGTIEAIKKFQKRIGNPETGTLSAAELDRLLKEGRAKKAAAGFKELTDKAAGVYVGVPLAWVSSPTTTKWGQHWYGKKAGLAIDTLRFGSEVSLRDLYDKLLKINNRTIGYQRFVDNKWFVISAFEGNAAVYVRADVVAVGGQTEIRGFSIWMSKDRPVEYQALAPAMTSSFKSTDPIGGPVADITRRGPPPADTAKRELQLQPNPPPIPTDKPSPASLDECLRGLGPSYCPPVLSARP